MMPGRTAAMYDEAAIAYTTIDGVSYGLASPGAVSKNEGILIRKDWLDKLGLDVPVTTEDYMEVMKEAPNHIDPVEIQDTVVVQAVDLHLYDAFIHGKAGAAL